MNLKPSDHQIANKAKKKINSAIVIGAYGGEHVGDAAILGGVLLRLKEKYGVTSAIIASSRPDRTQRWVSELSLPVNTHELLIIQQAISKMRWFVLIYWSMEVVQLWICHDH